MQRGEKKKGCEKMQKQEIMIYKEIQKNTHNEQLATQISKQSLKYAEIRNQAYDKLLEAHAQPYRSSYMENLMLNGSIQYNTLLNTSTGRIAELMIKGSNEGVLEMNKVLNHNGSAGEQAIGLARKLIEFEEKNIAGMRKYL